MVAGKSPEWLPPGFTEKIKRKNGKNIKYYLNDATGAKYNSKKDVINAATTEIVSNVILELANGTETTNDDDHGLSSNNKVDVISVNTNDSLDGLPDGWTVEEKTRSGRSGSYKVYIDSSSGSKFYSRAAVDRYLNANTTTVQNKLEIVPQPNMPQTNAGHTPEKEKIESSLKTVTTMSPSADGLPSGWTKEMRTCKSGDKTRKYPVYIDSSSGHNFLSRAAVTRYLNTVAHANTTPMQNKLDKVDEHLPDMSPEPITNAGPVPEKKRKESSDKKIATVSASADGLPPAWIKETKITKSGNKRRKVPVDKVDEPLPDTSPEPITNAGPVPDKKRKESHNKKIATVSASADELPPGWIKETKITKSGNKRRKVPVYVNTSSGTRLFSRVAVDRYVNSPDHADATPLQNKLNNVDEPLSGMSQQLPLTNASPFTEKKTKESSYKMVDSVSTPADGLPPGWIKEIRTVQCGDKIRKEPYFTDPVSGYVFLSKPDALRYLKTGDIRYCKCRPKRKELDGPKLMGNEIPVSIPMNEQVVTVSTPADGLPPGWTKEIKTSQCGDKIRKEPENPDMQELISKCIYWQNQSQAFEERVTAVNAQVTKHEDELKKAKEKEARLVATLEASLFREEQKSSHLEAAQNELKSVKMELDDKTSQLESAQNELKSVKMELDEKTSRLEAAQKELDEKTSQLEASQKELKAIKMWLDEKTSQLESTQKRAQAVKMGLDEKTSRLETAQKEVNERRKEVLTLTEELSREKEKVVELEKANCQNQLGPKGFDMNRFGPFRVDGPGNSFNNPTSSSTSGVVPNPQEDEFASLFGNHIDRGQGQGQPRWPRFF